METLEKKLQKIKAKKTYFISDDDVKWLIQTIEQYHLQEQLLLYRLKKAEKISVKISKMGELQEVIV
jgi:hypothetical protein